MEAASGGAGARPPLAGSPPASLPHSPQLTTRAGLVPALGARALPAEPPLRPATHSPHLPLPPWHSGAPDPGLQPESVPSAWVLPPAPPAGRSLAEWAPTWCDTCSLDAPFPAQVRFCSLAALQASHLRLPSRAVPAGRRRGCSPALLEPAVPWLKPRVLECARWGMRVYSSAQAAVTNTTDCGV